MYQTLLVVRTRIQSDGSIARWLANNTEGYVIGDSMFTTTFHKQSSRLAVKR